MNEIEIIKTKNLLNQVGLIRKKYDDLAEYTGENYNIFDVLNIYHHELSHSAIIGNLLNAQGKHGQKDAFLKLFLEEVKGFEEKKDQYWILKKFETEKSKTSTEMHIGKVVHKDEEGGRIDILISDSKSKIIIENKIWAGDQDQQLLRYKNHDNIAPIIYLTLDGKEPTLKSKGDLKLGINFICMSYKIEIVRWIENCIKEMANKPIIRESLNQYLNLIKELTNQSKNNSMKDVINLILENKDNFEAAKLVSNTLNSIENNLIKKLDQIVKIGESEINNFNYLIKENTLFTRIKIVHRFIYNGVKMIRFDVFTSDDPKNYECIVIQLEVIDYKIRNFVWSNNKEFEDKLYNNKNRLDFYYDNDNSVEYIIERIKDQVKEITFLLASTK